MMAPTRRSLAHAPTTTPCCLLLVAAILLLSGGQQADARLPSPEAANATTVTGPHCLYPLTIDSGNSPLTISGQVYSGSRMTADPEVKQDTADIKFGGTLYLPLPCNCPTTASEFKSGGARVIVDALRADLTGAVGHDAYKPVAAAVTAGYEKVDGTFSRGESLAGDRLASPSCALVHKVETMFDQEEDDQVRLACTFAMASLRHDFGDDRAADLKLHGSLLALAPLSAGQAVW